MKNNILSISEYRNNPEFYFTKGLRLANKKNLSEAYKSLLKALELEPDNSEYKFNMACFLSELQRPREANRIFNDILINFDPNMFDCFFGLGCNSFEEGNNEKAAEYFDKYLYFDSEGEFSYEISEMAFYLKLYSGVSHDNKFLKNSEDNFKKALKYFREGKPGEAIRYLYKSIQLNPLNIEARNCLTLALMLEKKFIRSVYINSTVKTINREHIWGTCLSIYLLKNSKRKAEFQRNLEMLPYRQINNREELLCTVTTLFLFGKTPELEKFIEKYAVEYSDQFIYSVLLLTYIINGNTDELEKINAVLENYAAANQDFKEWLKFVNQPNNKNAVISSAVEQYIKIFSLTSEKNNLKYDPSIYRVFAEDQNKQNKLKLSKKYYPIIEVAVRNREIMYSRLYKKEIIGILTSAVTGLTEPLVPDKGSYDMYSAALEYLYCKQYSIQMMKEELVSKYKITNSDLNKALKILNVEV